MAIQTYHDTNRTIALRNGQRTNVYLGVLDYNTMDNVDRLVSQAFSSRQGTVVLFDRSNPINPIARTFPAAQITEYTGSSPSVSHPPSQQLSLPEVAQHDDTQSDNRSFILFNPDLVLPIALTIFSAIYYLYSKR